MTENTTLVAYSEIALKSEPVRRYLENMLIENIRYALMRNGLAGAKIGKLRGRIIVQGVDAKRGASVASKIFGVALAMPAVETTASLNDIVETAADMADKIMATGQTFAIEARRAGKHPYTSKEIEVQAGSEVLKRLTDRNIRVDLDNPDKVVYVEAREGVTYVYSEVLNGPGGLPLGSQGRVVALLSGGVDSATASWLIMKRGALTIPLYLSTSPYGDAICRKRAINVAKFLREYVTVANYRLTIVPYGKILKEFIAQCPPKLTCVLCKRTMYRIACKFAEMKGAKAVVTGESLGQVASQTLTNLNVLDEATSLPVFRPLIGMDKNEIEKLAKKIGFQEIAARKTLPCKAVPIKPTTAAKLEEVKKAEERLDLDKIIAKALANIKEIIL